MYNDRRRQYEQLMQTHGLGFSYSFSALPNIKSEDNLVDKSSSLKILQRKKIRARFSLSKPSDKSRIALSHLKLDRLPIVNKALNPLVLEQRPQLFRKKRFEKLVQQISSNIGVRTNRRQ